MFVQTAPGHISSSLTDRRILNEQFGAKFVHRLLKRDMNLKILLSLHTSFTRIDREQLRIGYFDLSIIKDTLKINRSLE
jgi:hypothetical protein